MKDQRDEVALRIFVEIIVFDATQPNRSHTIDCKMIAEYSFKCAEKWLAARYDVDMKAGSRAT